MLQGRHQVEGGSGWSDPGKGSKAGGPELVDLAVTAGDVRLGAVLCGPQVGSEQPGKAQTDVVLGLGHKHRGRCYQQRPS